MSRGPTSRRSGTPFISYSANFQPGLFSDRSIFARMPAALTVSSSSSAFSVTPGLWLATGMTTSWMGAMRGGRTRPSLSPWVMMIAPIRRVDTPHEVCSMYCRVLFLSV